MTTIGLLDFSSIFRTHWHASADQSRNDAVARTIDSVRSLARRIETGDRSIDIDHAVICVDRPPYRRSEKMSDYKAHREKQSADLYAAADRCLAALGEAGYAIAGADGYEADDVIATIAHHITGSGPDDAVIAISSDKDLHQILGPRVTMYSIYHRAIRDADWLYETCGLHPPQYPDYLALRGDASDGIPGIKGIGAKTGARLVSELGSIEAIVEAAAKDKLPPACGRFASVILAAPLDLWLEIATLDRFVPVDLEAALAPRELGEIRLEREEPVPEAGTAPAEPTMDADEEEPIDTEPGRKPTKTRGMRDGRFERELEPRSLEQLAWTAKMLFASGLFSRLGSPEAIMTVIMAGREHGMTAVAALRSFVLLEGRLSLTAQGMVGLIKRSGVCEYWRVVERTADHATIETKRVGAPAPARVTFSIEDARRAGLTEGSPTRKGSRARGNWEKYPADMCVARASTALGRIEYPDVVGNLYSTEEVEQFDG